MNEIERLEKEGKPVPELTE